jgi:dUTP pyrophosphatase
MLWQVDERYGGSEVRFWKTHPMACNPTYGTKRSAGFDLHTVESVKVAQGEIKLVRTGLIIETPLDHMLYLTFRSSTPRKHGVMVLEGIVDEDYCGPEDELRIQVMGVSPGVATIPAGSRIAQGIFVPITRGQFKLTPFPVDTKSRGGFGSTG